MPHFNLSFWSLSERYRVRLANPMLFPCKPYDLRLQTLCFDKAKAELYESKLFVMRNQLYYNVLLEIIAFF